MQKIIAISNQKGGVGKTTITRELSYFLSGKEIKTLIIDADAQGNLTKSFIDSTSTGLYDAISGNEFDVEKITDNLHLLSGDLRLSLLEKSLIGEIDAYTRIKDIIQSGLLSDYEFIIIDCPPSLGILTLNSLAVAQYLLVPVRPAIYSLQGTNDLIKTVSKIKRNLNEHLTLTGVIINEYSQNPIIFRQIKDELQSSFGDLLFSSMLSKSIKLEESIINRKGVISTLCKSQIEVEAMGNELLSKVGYESR